MSKNRHLDPLFRPRAVAVVGASERPLSIGHIVVKNLLDHGFHGTIHPIHPSAKEIPGLKVVPSVGEVPAEIDLCNISVGWTHVPGILEECGRKGVRFCIVHTAGYKESGPEGAERERELVVLARRHGLRLFGPNSQGVQNSDPEISLYANFTFVPMRPGTISILAQGGGMGELLKLHLHQAGIGHRLYASYGNEADLSMPELLEYFGQDEGTSVILMQVESFKDPVAFLKAASGITPSKPILALKGGRTLEGVRAASSHTGSLVDQRALTSALFHRAGVLELRDSDELIKAAIALSTQPVPAGRRLGIITNTGSPAIQAVDEAVERGLSLAEWSEAGRQRLAASLLPEASTGNPVDVVATARPEHYFEALDTLLREEGVDLVMVFFVTAPFVDLEGIARRLREAASGANKPIAMVVETLERGSWLVRSLREAGFPVYEFAEDGVRSLSVMSRYGELRDRREEPPPHLLRDRATAEVILGRHEGRGLYLPQLDAFTVLAAYGIPIPRIAPVRSRGDLSTSSARVGFPCVLKADGPGIVHKSEVGAVTLDIPTVEALERAYDEMAERLAGRPASFILQEQRPPGLEVFVGASEAGSLGHLLLFGLGGVFIEVMKDFSVRLAPLSRPEARAMIRAIKIYPLLAGLRGQAGVDLGAVEDLLLRVSHLVRDFPSIQELDMNPILLYARGTPPAAVDVRMRIG